MVTLYRGTSSLLNLLFLIDGNGYGRTTVVENTKEPNKYSTPYRKKVPHLLNQSSLTRTGKHNMDNGPKASGFRQ